MSQMTGKSSILLEKKVYILNSASIVGKKEGEGPLGNLVDMVGEDDLFGCNTWEEAESNLQKEACSKRLSCLQSGRGGLSWRPMGIGF